MKTKLYSLMVLLIVSLTKVYSVDYYCKATGGLTTLSTWGTNPDGTGTAPGNWNGNNVWHFANRSSGNINAFSPPSTATSVIETGFNLTVSGNFGIGLNQKIDIASGGTLTITKTNSANYAFNLLDGDSYVIYNTSVQRIVDGNYGNLVVATSTSISPSADNVYVYNTLILNGGTVLTMNGKGIRLLGNNGHISGSGLIRGDQLAFFECYGGNGGDNGALNFQPGFQVLDYLFLLFDNPTDYISLGSNLNITFGNNGTFYQMMGGLNLNGFNLIIDNTADASFVTSASDGFIMGNANSGLFIEGSIGNFSSANDLFMHSTSNTLGVLHLTNGATLNAGNALRINDSLSLKGGSTFNSNGNLTLVSTSTLKGRIADLSNGSLGGNITVQTMAPGPTTDWAVLGVSGVSGQVLSNWDGQIPMTCNGCQNPTTSVQPGGFASVCSWDESAPAGDPNAYVTLSNTTPLAPGQGFWVYLGSTLTTTSDLFWNVSGSPVTGNVSIPLTNSGASNGDGFNLISNPYPSPISWAKLRNGNALVENATYIYNADLGITTSYVNGVSSNANGANDVIPMGQGFYVRAVSPTNLTAQESNKVHQNTGANPLIKSTQSSNSTYYGEVFRLNVNGGGWEDATAIRFHPFATSNFDIEYDAWKIYSSPGYIGYPGIWNKRTSIATQSQNQDLSVNSLKMPTVSNLSLPVVVKVYASGQHTISATEIENIPSDMCVTLKDKYNNVITDLRTSSYVCYISDTTNAARFELTVCAKTVVTDLNNQTLSDVNTIFISKDNKGIFTTLNFPQTTNATISVTNILGQKLMNDKMITTKEEQVYLDLNTTEQLIFVTVKTDKERVTKKFVNIN
jgi:hypothetical protein